MAFKHDYAKGRGNAYDDFGNLTSKGLLGGTQNGDGIGKKIKAFFQRGKKRGTGGQVTGATTPLSKNIDKLTPSQINELFYGEKKGSITPKAITEK